MGDTTALALPGRLLALARTDLGDHDQARDHFVISLALYQRLGLVDASQAAMNELLGVLPELDDGIAPAPPEPLASQLTAWGMAHTRALAQQPPCAQSSSGAACTG